MDASEQHNRLAHEFVQSVGRGTRAPERDRCRPETVILASMRLMTMHGQQPRVSAAMMEAPCSVRLNASRKTLAGSSKEAPPMGSASPEKLFLDDREIASRLGVKPNLFTAIAKTLEKSGFHGPIRSSRTSATGPPAGPSSTAAIMSIRMPAGRCPVAA